MPIFLLIYYTVPEKYGNLILFLGSLFFYAYGEHRFFEAMLSYGHRWGDFGWDSSFTFSANKN